MQYLKRIAFLTDYDKCMLTTCFPTLFSNAVTMSCLIFDATSRNENDLMKVLFGNQDVSTTGDEPGTFVWHVKNKYYSAKVEVDVVTSLEAVTSARVGRTHAVVYFGGKIQSSSVASAIEDWHRAMGMEGTRDAKL